MNIDKEKLKHLYTTKIIERENARERETNMHRQARQFSGEVNFVLDEMGIANMTTDACENRVYATSHRGRQWLQLTPGVKIVGRDNGLWYLQVGGLLNENYGSVYIDDLAESFITEIINQAAEL